MTPRTKSKQTTRNKIFKFLLCSSLITVVVVISIPSGIRCYAKPRQAEALTYIGSLNRSQQAYFLEKGAFINSIPSDFGIPNKTEAYKYFSGFVQKISIPNYVISITKSYSQSKQEYLENYFGVVWTVTPVQKEELAKYNPTTFSILCKTSNPNLIPSSNSQVEFSKDFKSASCPKGMEELK